MKIFFFLPLFSLALFFNPIRPERVSELYFRTPKVMQPGEELTYVVSYSFIKLGEVKLKVKNSKIINGKTAYNTVAYIDSYSGLPFVNLHQIYESILNSNYFSLFFNGIVKYPEYSSYTHYYFQYDSSKIRIVKGKINPPEVWTDSTTSAYTQYQDGLSIFYYARMNCGQKMSVNLPCFVNEKKVFTRINFYPEVVKENIDAVNYDIACVRLDGKTDFVSVFGLTGYFQGWFSNDEASIPVIAKMKVIIGNIKLELVKWKREGWTPPRYQD